MNVNKIAPRQEQLSANIRFMNIFNHRANEIAQSMNRNTASASRGLFALLPILLIASFAEYAWKKSQARRS